MDTPIKPISSTENTPTEPLQLVRNLALVAHDNMKKELLEWAKYNKKLLQQTHLTATGTTGKLLSEALDMPITKLLSGPLGGDQQLGALIAERKIDILIFFWDPLEPQPHDPDVRALLRLAQVWNIPVASNRATADYLISSPLFKNDYMHLRPDYSDYTQRVLPK